MEQFSLEKYLENPSRKVVTRRGNPVRIICTDRKHGEDTLPIVFLEESPDGIGEFLLSCRANGTCDNYDTPYDIFFADEKKEELTEFEKQLGVYIYFPKLSCEFNEEEKKYIKDAANTLLNLARKELGLVDNTCGEYALNEAYKQGKQDALKDLPKWKRATEDKKFDKHVCVMDYYMSPFLDTEVNEGDYYIKLSDLKTLSKEE
jgi:hypothetical protein